MKDLKTSYQKHLIAFMAWNVTLYLVVILVGNDVANFNFSFSKLTSTGIFIALGPILTLVIGGWVSTDTKTSLVYLRRVNPLPGSRAFDSPLIDDPRINRDALQMNLGEFPVDPAEQNRVWYGLYKDIGKDNGIGQSHRAWLFSRDLTGYSFIFLVGLGSLAWLLSPKALPALFYILILILQYFIVMVSARTYGNRFVTNVLAMASNKK